MFPQVKRKILCDYHGHASLTSVHIIRYQHHFFNRNVVWWVVYWSHSVLCGLVLAKCSIIVGEWRWRRANAMNTGAGWLTTGKNTLFLLVNETRREVQRLMSLYAVQIAQKIKSTHLCIITWPTCIITWLTCITELWSHVYYLHDLCMDNCYKWRTTRVWF